MGTAKTLTPWQKLTDRVRVRRDSVADIFLLASISDDPGKGFFYCVGQRPPVYVSDLATAQRAADAVAVALGWTLADAIENAASPFVNRAIDTVPAASPIVTGPRCLLTATGARACEGVVWSPALADLTEARHRQPLTDRPEDATCPGCAPIAKRILRERTRREIDALLAEDARRVPAFALARKAAVLAWFECKPDIDAEDIARLPASLASLHYYEAHRSDPERRRRPCRDGGIREVYERTRPLCGRPTL